MNARALFITILAVLLFTCAMAPFAAAQGSPNQAVLRQLADQFRQRLDQHRPQLYYDMLASTDPAQAALNRNPNIQLMYIDDLGMPVYFTITNLNAAKTISTNRVWPAGGAGYSLTGSGTASNQFAIWDGGGVLSTHQEFGSRITNGDSHGGSASHATFVAGTMVAAGVQANAKGMSYEANLTSFDWNSDNSEMSTAAGNGLLVSNHSYGRITGWSYGYDDPNEWYWFGNASISTTEDYGFGFYGSDAQAWDQIAYNAPNYLIVKSAGNDRNDSGPGPGGGHYYWNGGWTWSTTTRDADGGPDGYDSVSWKSTAKNILTVGAVIDIPLGYSDPSQVVQASFSCWGPCDDGRIKPDILGNGVGLYSCSNSSNTAYTSGSGTSASAPNVSGSINLLIRHYETEYAATPRSATMKGLVIHAADEAGEYPGPDYQNGWGLMNTETAADIISLSPAQIIENNLVSGSNTHNFTISQSGNLRVTICWTDPPGTSPPASLDPATPMLVNDLDLRLEHIPTGTIYYPWRLDPANPADAATTGDNAIDNVEVIDAACAPAGQYTATVTHKGSLGGGQDYTLIWSNTIIADPCAVEESIIDFGSIEMFTFVDTTVTITNLGCDTLWGTVSETSDHFSIEAGAGAYELTPGQSLDVTIRYQPVTLGAHSTTIETGDALCDDIFCVGYSLEPPPTCTIDPDTLDFGNVETGGYSLLSFTITNTGYQTLEGNVGEACTQYLVTSGAGPFSLTHDQVHNVTVYFFPSVAGPDTCIIDTGTGGCSDVIAIGYGGSAPACFTWPDTLDFGLVQVGSSRDSSGIYLTNTGEGTLNGTVSEICDDFSILSGGGPFSLAGGDTNFVSVRFEPTTAGTLFCALTTGTADCDTIVLTGRAEYPPSCLVEPDTLDFGVRPVGSWTDSIGVAINTGGGTLNGDVTITMGPFSILSGSGPFSVAGGDTHSVGIRFQPVEPGTSTAFIDFGTPDCGGIFCRGIAEPQPFCAVDTDTLTYGLVVLGDSLDLTFSITNTGGGTLFGDVTETCDYYSIVSGGGPYALAGGDTVRVTVRFKPMVGGEQVCVIGTSSPECGDITCIGTGDDVTGAGPSGPLAFKLFQNYPNPFKRTTRIQYSTDREGVVLLRVFDISGKHVRTIMNRNRTPGVYTEEWDGRDSAGNRVASGIYFYQLKMGQRIVTRKAVLLK